MLALPWGWRVGAGCKGREKKGYLQSGSSSKDENRGRKRRATLQTPQEAEPHIPALLHPQPTPALHPCDKNGEISICGKGGREMAPESVEVYRANNQKIIVNPITLNSTLQKCSGVFLKPSPAAAMNPRVICTAPVNEKIFTFQ